MKKYLKNLLRNLLRSYGYVKLNNDQFVGKFPDRYTDNLSMTQQNGSLFELGDVENWIFKNKNNEEDITRFIFLNLCLDTLLEEKITGHLAELGVYKGNSALLLAKYARHTKQICYLFDTFEGFDSRDLNSIDMISNSLLFTDTSLNEVRDFIGTENVFYASGWFPETVKYLNGDETFALVHMDMDLESPTKSALEYFYPRLSKGGFIILHDYSSGYWPGSRKAITEFFSDKPEFVIPVADKSGTAVIRKI